MINLVTKFPRLYGKTRTGAIKFWEIEASGATMIIRNGLQGGVTKEQTKKIDGKNFGRANATDPIQQCQLECQSKWQAKKDEQYVESIKAVGDYADKEILLPMLAQKYQDRKHNLKWPVLIQPKLNGVRCIFQGDKFMSRKGKEFPGMEHLREELAKLISLGVEIPDGELYIHGATFQEIVRLVKKDRGGDELKYWIYDCVNKDKFLDRNKIIKRVFEHKFKYLVYVPTIIVSDDKGVKKLHDEYVQEGYEGVIVRNIDGEYLVKHRSNDLLKYKEFIDEEFKIVGAEQGAGVEEGCVIWVCITKEGKEFNVRPKGTHEIRREWYKDRKKIISKNLTVRYQNFSEELKPVFPVGIAVRDYE